LNSVPLRFKVESPEPAPLLEKRLIFLFRKISVFLYPFSAVFSPILAKFRQKKSGLLFFVSR